MAGSNYRNITDIKPNPKNPVLPVYRNVIFRCQQCSCAFVSNKLSAHRKPLYCSKACYSQSLKINKPCAHCGAAINGKGAAVHSRVYCSVKCQGNARAGVELPAEWKSALSAGRLSSEKCKGPNLYNWKGGKETEKLRMKAAFYKRKKLLTLPFDAEFLKRVLIAQKGLCFFCETSLEKYKAIEHLTPVSRGGDNENYNLVYCCKSCNSKKRQQTLEEYAINNRRFDWLAKFEIVYASSIY